MLKIAENDVQKLKELEQLRKSFLEKEADLRRSPIVLKSPIAKGK